jgi:uncharacterized protein (DUF697 family)
MTTNPISVSPDLTHGIIDHEANAHLANNIVYKYTAIASGAGLIPVPFLDLLALGGIQLAMLNALGKLYNYKFEEHRAKSIIGVLTTSLPANALIKTTSTLFKIVPFIGPILGGISGYIYSAASTYALGKVFNAHFASGMSLLSLDVDKMKHEFQAFHSDYIKANSKPVNVTESVAK